jgi:hypothetical protein
VPLTASHSQDPATFGGVILVEYNRNIFGVALFFSFEAETKDLPHFIK